MIWIPDTIVAGDAYASSAPGSEMRWQRRVWELLAHCHCAERLESQSVEALASALSAFMGAPSRDRPALDAGRLAPLIARALDALGACVEARKVLAIGTGVAHATRWQACGDEGVWTLDLRRLPETAEGGTELLLFACVGTLIEAIADLWDANAGRGALGLRGAERIAARVLNRAGRSRESRALEAEVRARGQQRLQRIASQRGWQYTPYVFLQDF